MRAEAQIRPKAALPVAHRAAAGPSGAGDARQGHAMPPIALVGCRALVAGRQPDRLLEPAESLREIGCELLGPACCAGEAEGLLRCQRPNIALLDLSLGMEGVLRLAPALAGAAVPWALLTCGPADPAFAHPLLRDAPCLPWLRFADGLLPTVRRLYRADLEARLAVDDRQIAAARERLAAQIARIERVAAHGGDTFAAERILRGIARSLRVMRAHRAWLAQRLMGGQGRLDGAQGRLIPY